jgi:uncharacterized protein
VDPVTADPARPVRPALLALQWLDVAFLHWPVDPQVAAPLMPPGTRPDVFGGTTYVGLVAFRMHQVRLPGLPALPYFGSFPETNVRLYSVGADGRRGVVFCSLDASRLAPALLGRAAVRLAYQWSRMRLHRDGDLVSYDSRRRWPGPAGTHMRLRLLVGEPVAEPSGEEHFFTARWGLHGTWYRRQAFYLANAHPQWPLHRARLLDLSEDLIAATGLPAPAGEPASVLYSPGVHARFGIPWQPRPGSAARR